MIETRNLTQYAALHRKQVYGTGGWKRRRNVEPWIAIAAPTSVLDYGAGRSTLIFDLKVRGIEHRDRYDPAIPEISSIPCDRYDAIICTDVMEHFDDNEIDAILADIERLSATVVFCIHLKTAATNLPNGENRHATVMPAEWWLRRVRAFFPDARIVGKSERVVTICTRPLTPKQVLVGRLHTLWLTVRYSVERQFRKKKIPPR